MSCQNGPAGGGNEPAVDKKREFPQPIWAIPGMPGYPAALENIGGVSAPLLAGFSASLVGLLLDKDIAWGIWWPDQAMLLFVLTVICFIGVIQATIYARAYAATPDEMKSWYEELNNDKWKHELIEEHRRYINEHQKWSYISSALYRIGIVAFLTGLTLIVIPRDLDDFTVTRVMVIGIAAVGLIAELLWIVISFAKAAAESRSRTSTSSS